MRRAAIAAAVAVALVLALLAVAALRIRPEAFRAPLESALSRALEHPVALGELGVQLLPTPAVRARNVRVERASGQGGALAEAEELRLELALLPLLVGRVVPRALELDGLSLELPSDASGRPLLPSASAQSAPAGASDAASLPLDSLRIRRGRLRAGDFSAERVELVAQLDPDGSARVMLDADLPGLGELRATQVELAVPRSGARSGRIQGRIERAELAPLAQALGLIDTREPAGEGGGLAGEFALEFADGRLSAGSLSLAGQQVSSALGPAALSGAVSLRARLGADWQLDLAGASVRLGPLHKPAGVPLALRGELASELPPAQPLRAELVLDGANLAFELAREGESTRLRFDPSRLPAAALAPLLGPGWRGSGGGLRSGGLWLQSAPREARGELVFDALALEHGSARYSASGTVRAEGTRVASDELELRLNGEPVRAAGSYDLERDRGELALDAEGRALEQLVAAFRPGSPVTGQLSGHFDLRSAELLPGSSGPPHLSGQGWLRITRGSLRDFSIVEQALGQLGSVPGLLARLTGRELAQLEEEQFEQLAGDFTLSAQRLETRNLVVDFRGASAELEGWLNVLSGALSLHGRLVISPVLDAELSGAVPEGPRVIPIEQVGGTLAKPSVRLDRAAVASVASGYLVQGRIRERIEERLGPGSAELVDGILKALLQSRGSSR